MAHTSDALSGNSREAKSIHALLPIKQAQAQAGIATSKREKARGAGAVAARYTLVGNSASCLTSTGGDDAFPQIHGSPNATQRRLDSNPVPFATQNRVGLYGRCQHQSAGLCCGANLTPVWLLAHQADIGICGAVGPMIR